MPALGSGLKVLGSGLGPAIKPGTDVRLRAPRYGGQPSRGLPTVAHPLASVSEGWCPALAGPRRRGPKCKSLRLEPKACITCDDARVEGFADGRARMRF